MATDTRQSQETTRVLRNFVGGDWADSAGDDRLEIVNPAIAETVATAPVSTAEDVDRAVRAARAAFPSWSTTTPAERSLALLRLADALEEITPDLATLESAETGKPIAGFRDGEMPSIVDSLRFFAGAARCLDGRAAGEYLAGYASIIRREPVGVVGQIAPWNYPLMIAVWKLGATLAAGNTSVFKPADNTPSTTLRLAELAQAHLPAGVVNIVCGPGSTGEAIVGHPDIDMVGITGSVRSGKRVAALASETLKRVHLELGGNAPVLIFDDADLESAIPDIAGAGYYNAGQDCVAATRVLAGPNVYDRVVDGLARASQELQIGDPLEETTSLGPMISAAARERVAGMLERRPQQAELVTGGDAPKRPGYFLEPAVVAGAPQESEMIQGEIFGPVITVQRFDDEAQAVKWANGTPYGLGASVFTHDVGRSLRVSNALRVGLVWVNAHMPMTAEMPHGGVKSSGYGKDQSIYALEDYMTMKHVMVALGDGRA